MFPRVSGLQRWSLWLMIEKWGCCTDPRIHQLVSSELRAVRGWEPVWRAGSLGGILPHGSTLTSASWLPRCELIFTTVTLYHPVSTLEPARRSHELWAKIQRSSSCAYWILCLRDRRVSRTCLMPDIMTALPVLIHSVFTKTLGEKQYQCRWLESRCNSSSLI